jgi:hypothetical protein
MEKNIYPGPLVKVPGVGYVAMTDPETTFMYLKHSAMDVMGDILFEWKLKMMEEENPSLRFLDGIQDKVGIDYETNQSVYRRRR